MASPNTLREEIPLRAHFVRPKKIQLGALFGLKSCKRAGLGALSAEHVYRTVPKNQHCIIMTRLRNQVFQIIFQILCDFHITSILSQKL